MADPKVQEALVRQGSVLMPLGPQPFAAYMARDTARWKEVAATIEYRPTA
jgi:tripartite-type tricarboxylate transporter receptor subunit TctC